MKCLITAFSVVVLTSFSLATSASAATCSRHYNTCMERGYGEKKCGCARRICIKKVGSEDTGPKDGGRWNWIPGINACFKN